MTNFFQNIPMHRFQLHTLLSYSPCSSGSCSISDELWYRLKRHLLCWLKYRVQTNGEFLLPFTSTAILKRMLSLRCISWWHGVLQALSSWTISLAPFRVKIYAGSISLVACKQNVVSKFRNIWVVLVKLVHLFSPWSCHLWKKQVSWLASYIEEWWRK